MNLYVYLCDRKEPGEVSPYSDGLRVKRSGFDSKQGQYIFLYLAASSRLRGPSSLQFVGYRGLFPRR
jgi:hypothetical protein